MTLHSFFSLSAPVKKPKLQFPAQKGISYNPLKNRVRFSLNERVITMLPEEGGKAKNAVRGGEGPRCRHLRARRDLSAGWQRSHGSRRCMLPPHMSVFPYVSREARAGHEEGAGIAGTCPDLESRKHESGQGAGTSCTCNPQDGVAPAFAPCTCPCVNPRAKCRVRFARTGGRGSWPLCGGKCAVFS